MTTVADKPRPGDRSRSPADIPPAASGPAWRAYLRALGPGLVTGASDDDPSGIATYSQAGASFGFGFLWAALLTFPLMATVQEICDRAALATGKGLGELATQRLQAKGRWFVALLIGALIVANALNISADLVAVGSGMNLLHAGPTSIWALVAGAGISVLVMTGSFELVARVFKLLCIALLSYIAMLFIVHVDWRSVAAATFLPHLSSSGSYLALLVAVLGTTISPYLFFWQPLHRVEEMRDEPAGGSQPKPLADRSDQAAQKKQRTSRFDVLSGMAFSNIVMFAIVVATAVSLGAHGKHNIASAAEAASALRPIAGEFASALFALGFIGAGMLAIPVLAGAGSAGMAGLLGKTAGFSRSPRKAPVFYGLVLLGTIGGSALSLLGINPIRLLVLVAAVNGVAAGPFLVLLMLITSDSAIMGEYVNGRFTRSVGWAAAAIMAVAAIVLFAFAGGGGLY